MAMDVFSRMAVGFYVSFDPPSSGTLIISRQKSLQLSSRMR
jgi:hypothetical protein